VQFKACIIVASTFHLKRYRTPENALSVQNKAIHAASFRNALQGINGTVRIIFRNAGTDRAETISRRGSRADCITLSRRSSRAPYQPEPIPRYQIDRAGMIQRYAIKRRPIPTGAGTTGQTAPTESARNDHTKPEQLVTVSPCRIFAALRSGDCTAGAMLHYFHARKCFLRFFCAEFSELHQMSICGNS